MDIDWIPAAWLYATFVFSTTLHEAAHAFAAWKLGDDTAYRGGQVSLDPTRHIRREPIGMVALPLLTLLGGGYLIGWASTPYNAQWAMTYPRRSALMALAGPAANALLVLLAVGAMWICASQGHMQIAVSADSRPAMLGVVEATGDGVWPVAAMLLSAMFSLNLLLLALNLMPVPPLDGSAILSLLLPAGLARRYQVSLHTSRGLGWIGVIFMLVLFRYIYGPIWKAAVGALL